MKTKGFNRFLASVMAICLVIGMLPVTAFAEGDDTSDPTRSVSDGVDSVNTEENLPEEDSDGDAQIPVITAFAALEETSFDAVPGTAYEEVAAGLDEAYPTVTATVDDEETEIDVTWSSADYDADAAGTYTFTAENASNVDYALDEGVEWPSVSVTLVEATPLADSDGYTNFPLTSSMAFYNLLEAGYKYRLTQDWTWNVESAKSAISKTGSLVWDLNGHTLTITGDAVQVLANVELVIEDNSADKNGEIILENDSTAWGCSILVSAGGSFEMTGGTLTSTQSYYPLKVVGGSTATISGGTISSSASSAVYVSGSDATKLNLAGGTLKSETGPAIYAGMSSIEITSGSVIYPAESTLFDGSDASRTVSITGGTFSNDVSGYCDEGYEAVVGGDGTYTVQLKAQSTCVAQIGNEKYETLAEAVEAAGTSGAAVTITLLGDVDLTEPVEIAKGQNIILDLNGQTITEYGTGARKIFNYGTLTIKDSGTTGEIKNVEVGADGEDGSYGLIDNYGILTIESGSFTDVAHGNGSSLRNRSGGTLVINGGTFTNTADDSAAQTGNGYTGAANLFVYSDGSLQINGGTFIMEKARYTPAIKVVGSTATIKNASITTYMSGGIEVAGGNLSIESTTVKVSDANSYYANAIAVSGGGTANVLSGSYTGYSYGAYVYNSGGTINISGGTFEAGTAVLKADNSVTTNQSVINVTNGNFTGTYAIGNASVLSIAGGTFSSEVPEEYCAPGFEPKDNGDGTYGVAPSVSTAVDVIIYGSDGKVIMELGYDDIQDAVNEANDYIEMGQYEDSACYAVLRLNEDIQADVTIPADVELTLDLNGHTLTNVSSHTIYNNGALTITDSSTGAVGTVDNVTHARAAIYNEVGATCTILAGSFTRSLENGISSTNNGGNSYYTILNHGTMTIGEEGGNNDDITVTANGHYSSLVENGWQDGKQNTTGTPSSLTIYGGTFTGGINTIKNDECGDLTIAGGEFVNVTQHAVMNWNTAVITGGSFESSGYVLYNGQWGDYAEGKLTITDGSFTSGAGKAIFAQDGDSSEDIAISGGTFSSAVELSYCADGYIPAAANEAGKYTVEGGNYWVAIINPDGTYTGYTSQLSGVLYSNTKDGDTVVLLKDWTYAAFMPTIKTSITLDLNGHTLTGSNASNPTVCVEKTSGSRITATIKNGTIIGTASDALRLGRNADVTLENVTLSGNTYGMTVGDYSVSSQPSVTVTGADTTITGGNAGIALYSKSGGSEGAKLIVNDGTISGGVYGIAGNGTATHSNSMMEITINGGTVKSTGEAGAAIYHPQAGTLTITGGTIEGPVGVQMCSGSLVVSGEPTITATKPAGTKGEADGALPDGAAISIVNRGYPNGAPTADISGTPTVSATAGTDAVQAYTWADEAKSEWAEAGESVNISGGTYSTKPETALLAEGYVANLVPDDSGNYIVEQGTVIAQVVGTDGKATNYETIEAAIEAVQPGETIVLLEDVLLEDNTSVQIADKGTAESPITFDLNGHTISGSNGNSAGSTSTVANSGILTVYGSYVELTDSSDSKGGLTNTNTAASNTSAITVLPSDTNESHLTVDGGVVLVNESTNSFSKGIYVCTGGSTRAADVTVESASISSYKDAVATQNSTNVSAVINGGNFETRSTASSSYAISYNVTINGGTFTGGRLYTKLTNIGDGKAALLTKNEAGDYVVTVMDEADAEYVAYLEEAGTKLCVNDDLYLFQEISKLAGQTIHVVANAGLNFPEGQYFDASDKAAPSAMTLDLAESVTLSGSVPMALADITVTGSGTVAGDVFKTADADTYVVTQSDNVYQGRFVESKLGATVTNKTSGTIKYYSVDSMSDALKTFQSTTNKNTIVELYHDYNATMLVSVRGAGNELRLNGHTYTLTSAAQAVFALNNNAALEITGGTVDATNATLSAIVASGPANTNVEITIGEGATVKGTGIFMQGKTVTLNVYGTIDTTGTDEVAIQGNGSTGQGPTTVNIYDGAVVKSDTLAIFHPQSGTLNIEGGTITGDTGIYMRSGTLNVTGGTIEATGAKNAFNDAGSGWMSTGDAVLLYACGYPGGAPVVDEFGGDKLKVISANGQAVVCYAKEGAEDIADKNFITDGYFSNDVTEYCETGLAATLTESGMWTIGEVSKVAQVLNAEGEVVEEYATLQAAIAAAEDGQTVKLLTNAEISQTVVDKGITLDLGGYELTLVEDGNYNPYALYFTSGSSKITNGTILDGRSAGNTSAGYGMVDIRNAGTTLTTENVTLQTYCPNSTQAYNYILQVSGGAEVTVNEGTVLKDTMYGTEDYETYGAVGIAVYGNNAEQATKLTVNGGEIEVMGFAISGNGTNNATTTYKNTEIVIAGGSVTSTNGTAVYHPQGGTLTITGGVITGTTGVEVRAGTVTVSNGTDANGETTVPKITGTAKPMTSDPNGNGTTTDGVGIAVVQHNTKLPIDVTITGGEISGYTALYEANLQNNSPEDIDKVSITVEDGTFKAINGGTNAVYAGDPETIAVSGGQFSSVVPEEYCAEDYVPVTEPNEDNMYTVTQADPVAEVLDAEGNVVKSYATLQAAIDAATDGQTVKLLESVTESVTIAAGKSITLDLNGKTLTNTEGSHTIRNEGTLTIVDDSDGAVGTVDNVSHARAAVYNEVGATCTIQAGNYTRSAENGIDKENNGGNSYYTIFNHGTMTFETEDNSRITVSQGENREGRYSSMIENGWQNGNQNTDGVESVMTITGGTFTGGLNTVKNDDYGVLTITGGVFENASQATIMNWNVAEISGGVFTAEKNVVLNAYLDDSMDKGELTISGGTYTAGTGYDVIRQNDDAIGQVTITDGTFHYDQGADIIGDYIAGTNSDVAISGGEFSNVVPNDYCAPGYAPKTELNDNNMYTVYELNARNSNVEVLCRIGSSSNPSYSDTKYFLNLQEALDYAADFMETATNAGSEAVRATVKLLNNIKLTETAEVPNTGTYSGTFVMDLNSKTITEGENFTSDRLLEINQTAMYFIISGGGTITANKAQYAVYLNARSTLSNITVSANAVNGVAVYAGRLLDIDSGSYSGMQSALEVDAEARIGDSEENIYLTSQNGPAILVKTGGELNVQTSNSYGFNSNIVTGSVTITGATGVKVENVNNTTIAHFGAEDAADREKIGDLIVTGTNGYAVEGVNGAYVYIYDGYFYSSNETADVSGDNVRVIYDKEEADGNYAYFEHEIPKDSWRAQEKWESGRYNVYTSEALFTVKETVTVGDVRQEMYRLAYAVAQLVNESGVVSDKYVDLSKALTDAAANTEGYKTVQLLDNVTVDDDLTVSSGITLDLNGKTLTVSTLNVISGVIKDSVADTVGGTPGLLKATELILVSDSQKGVLPIGNSTNGYRLFSYVLKPHTNVPGDETVKFRFKLLFTNQDAYKYIVDGDFDFTMNGLLKVHDPAVENPEDEGYYVTLSFDYHDTLKTHASNIIKDTSHTQNSYSLTLNVTGLNGFEGEQLIFTVELTAGTFGTSDSITMDYVVPLKASTENTEPTETDGV